MSIILTDEQEKFIEKALNGKNILVDACVGSGKTTAIQALCTRFPKNKKILYLTYNKLLKIDAKEKIKGRNVTVTKMCIRDSTMRARVNIGGGVSCCYL